MPPARPPKPSPRLRLFELLRREPLQAKHGQAVRLAVVAYDEGRARELVADTYGQPWLSSAFARCREILFKEEEVLYEQFVGGG